MSSAASNAAARKRRAGGASLPSGGHQLPQNGVKKQEPVAQPQDKKVFMSVEQILFLLDNRIKKLESSSSSSSSSEQKDEDAEYDTVELIKRVEQLERENMEMKIKLADIQSVVIRLQSTTHIPPPPPISTFSVPDPNGWVPPPLEEQVEQMKFI